MNATNWRLLAISIDYLEDIIKNTDLGLSYLESQAVSDQTILSLYYPRQILKDIRGRAN